MLYVPFLAEKMVKKIRNKGTINVLQGGGGQRSMVKDHKITIFFGTLPLDHNQVTIIFFCPGMHGDWVKFGLQ